MGVFNWFPLCFTVVSNATSFFTIYVLNYPQRLDAHCPHFLGLLCHMHLSLMVCSIVIYVNNITMDLPTRVKSLGITSLTFNVLHYRKPFNMRLTNTPCFLLKELWIKTTNFVRRRLFFYAPLAISYWVLVVQLFHPLQTISIMNIPSNLPLRTNPKNIIV